MELNGQNLRYSSPSYSETQQAVESTSQRVPGPFYLWTAGGGGGRLGWWINRDRIEWGVEDPV